MLADQGKAFGELLRLACAQAFTVCLEASFPVGLFFEISQGIRKFLYRLELARVFGQNRECVFCDPAG